jgi:hypothetical protein
MINKAKFSAGKVVGTPGAMEAMLKAGASPLFLLKRHLSGDWGTLCESDKQANEDALIHGDRIMSVYNLPPDDTKIWVITESDRSVTTFLLPEDY